METWTTIMERRQRAMNSKIIRIIGLAATVIGLGAKICKFCK